MPPQAPRHHSYPPIVMPHDRGLADAAMASVPRDKIVSPSPSLHPNHRKTMTLAVVPRTTWKELFVHLAAVLVVLLSLRAVLFQEPHIVGMLSFVCIGLAVCVALQQHRLTDLQHASLQQSILRGQLVQLQHDNLFLRRDKRSLTEQVDSLQELELNLQQTAQLQGQNLQVLMRQVDSYRQGRSHTKHAVQHLILETLFGVLRRNEQGEYVLDPAQANLLLPELWSLEGVRFSEQTFRTVVARQGRQGLDVQGILAVVKNLLDEDLVPRERIFSYD